MMKYTSYVLTTAMVFNSFLSFPLANAAETVKGGAAGKSAAAKGPELTDEEKKMGGTLSPYPSCNNLMMVEESAYKKNSEYWKARAKSCDSATSNCNMKVQMIPDSGIFGSRGATMGKNLSSVVPVGAFLETVRVRASQDLSGSIKRYEQIQQKCLSGKAADATCAASLKQINTRLAEQLPSYRNAVSMMILPTNADVEKVLQSGDVSLLINEKFTKKRMMTNDFPEMDALSKEEYAAAKKELEDVLAAAKKAAAEQTEKDKARYQRSGLELELKKFLSESETKKRLDQKVHEAFADMRAKKLVAMNTAITKAPELFYVGRANASDAVLSAGLAKMTTDAKAALTRINQAPPKKSELSVAEVDKSLLQYAAYSQLIDKMISEEATKGGASSCAVATAAYNQLQLVKGRDAAYAGLAIAGSSILIAASPWALALRGATMSAGAASLAGNLSVTAGMIGGMAMTAHDIEVAKTTEEDYRAGLSTAEQVKEAKSGASIGVALAPLDFMGGGAVFGAAVGATAKSLSGLKRFGAAAVAKGEVKVAATSAAQVTDLATKVAAQGATAAEKKAAAQAAEKLAKTGDAAAKQILGRAPTSTDEKAFDVLAKAGFLGDANSPNVELMKQYGEITKGMSEAEVKHYASQIEKITAANGPIKASSKKTGAEAVAEAQRTKEAGALALAAAEVVEDPAQAKALGSIMKADSGWPTESVSGVRAVFQQMKETAGKGVKKTKESVAAVGERVRNAYAKLKGIDPNSKEAMDGCVCIGMCPLKARASNDANDALDALDSSPRFMACVAH